MRRATLTMRHVGAIGHLPFDEGIEENGAHDEGPGVPGGPGDGLVDTAPAFAGQPPRERIAEEGVRAIRFHRTVEGDPERGVGDVPNRLIRDRSHVSPA